MVAYFFDSSALAKRYVTETGTRWIQSLTDPAAGNSVYVACITLVELVAAISRRRKNGDLTPADADAALADLRADFVSDYQVIEVTAALVAQAEALAERLALRRYDAVQLLLLSKWPLDAINLTDPGSWWANAHLLPVEFNFLNLFWESPTRNCHPLLFPYLF